MKIIKRFFGFALTLALLVSMVVPVQADDNEVILVEGESYTKVNKAAAASSPHAALSGGDHLIFKSMPDEKLTKEGYIAMYKVKVSEAGAYYMDIISSPISLNSLSPYKIRINDGEYFDVTTQNTTKTGDLNETGVGKDLYYKYRLKPVQLRKGVNTIYFRVTEGRVNDGRIWFMLDCFTLTKAPWNITSIDVDAPFNVFEEKDDINAAISFIGADSKTHSLEYSVTDYFGNTVAKESATIPAGTEKIEIGFDKKPEQGFYTISASVDGLDPVKTGFSVLSNYDEREHIDETPFAMDVAAGMLFSIDKLPNYARVLRLMGVNYVRERIRWSQTNPAEGVFEFGRYNDIYDIYAENGIKVLELNHSAPAWLQQENKILPDDLVAAYEFGKAGMGNFENADWEFWNEPDIQFTAESETADTYAAYMKAAAIGAHDAGTGNDVSMAGIAYPPGNYMDLLMQNELMPYIDIYNFHAHRTGNSDSVLFDVPPAIVQQMSYLDAYNNWNKKIFISECGNTMPFKDETKELDAEQQKQQARYVVTSTLTSLSMGVDKHFWFILPYYVENNSGWGIFTQADTPLPAVNAEAVMTRVLGRGVYAGELEMPEGVTAYVFSNNGESTAVFWSETEKDIEIRTSQPEAVLTDIMGASAEVSAAGGTYKLKSGPDAQYLTIKGEFDGVGTDHYKKQFDTHVELTDAQRVVLKQVYPESTAARAKAKGYILNKGDKTELTLEVVNLNGKVMKGTVTGSTYGGWKLDANTKQVTVAPYSTERVAFTITGSDSVLADVSSPVIFTGEFDGNKTSKSTAIILSADDKEVEPDILLPGGADGANWKDNYSGGSTLEKTNLNGGETEYKYVMGDGDKWAYPIYDVPAGLDISKSAGLVFEIYFDDEIEGVTIRSFANENNGSSYLFLNGFGAHKGWNRIKMPWIDYSATSGQPDDNFHLDIDQIKTIQIGMNTRTEKNITYRIKNIGVYSQESGGVYGEITEMTPTNNEMFESGNINISAKLIRGEIAFDDSTLCVLADGEKIPFDIEDDIITANAVLGSGEHTILIRIFDASGRLAEQNVNIKTGGSN